MSAYQPIACIQHERLELSVLRKIPLALTLQADGHIQTLFILPMDVWTGRGAEWLKFRLLSEPPSATPVEIRLDQILEFTELDAAG